MCKSNKIIVKYDYYNRRIKTTGSYVCKDCTPFKREQTNIVRYGDSYLKTENFKEKRKKTCIDKYGFEHPLQNKNIIEKIHNTNLQKYGCVSPSQVKEFKEKFKKTSLEKYGVDNPLKNEEVKEKICNSNLKKYGVKNVMQSPEIRAKVNNTLCKNGTQKSSTQQRYIFNLYNKNDDAKLNYPISYYATDICFTEKNFVIEYDGGGHNLRVTLGRLTQEEFNQKEIIRNSIIKREGYKIMRIISSTDKLPSDEILLQMLEYAKQYFSQYPKHSWIEFLIDSSLVHNAEHKEGVFFDYGILRKIT